MFAKENMNELLVELQRTIHVHVEPLPVVNWEELFYTAGFSKMTCVTGPMSLMNVKGLIRDEGPLGAIPILKNGLKKEKRDHFKKNVYVF